MDLSRVLTPVKINGQEYPPSRLRLSPSDVAAKRHLGLVGAPQMPNVVPEPDFRINDCLRVKPMAHPRFRRT